MIAPPTNMPLLSLDLKALGQEMHAARCENPGANPYQLGYNVLVTHMRHRDMTGPDGEDIPYIVRDKRQ